MTRKALPRVCFPFLKCWLQDTKVIFTSQYVGAVLKNDVCKERLKRRRYVTLLWRWYGRTFHSLTILLLWRWYGRTKTKNALNNCEPVL